MKELRNDILVLHKCKEKADVSCVDLKDANLKLNCANLNCADLTKVDLLRNVNYSNLKLLLI